MRAPRPLRGMVVLLCSLAACTETKPPSASVGVVDAGAALTYREILRVDFNQRAQELFLPLYWREDANGDHQVSPDELAVLAGPWKPETYVLAGGFAPAFDAAYRAMRVLPDWKALPPEEGKRRQLVREELRQGRPTLVETDLSKWTERERAMLGHLADAARAIERLYARQQGTFELEKRIPADDTLSQAMYHRNQGPWCQAPKTEQDPACSAVPGGAPTRVSGLYPADVQSDPKFCERLVAEPNGVWLSGDHFSVVAHDPKGGFRTIPFSKAWPEDMAAVADALDAAGVSIAGPTPQEIPLQAYLLTVAGSFRTNEWELADRSWVRMAGKGSAWYVRVGPDEVDADPCGWKGGFGLQVGRINPGSAAWHARLQPVKGELEKVLAGMAGPPYTARPVRFPLPDFVDVVLTAGDSRSPHGARLGQSLPNWGPVAAEGGATAVITNLGTDAQSQKLLAVQMASVFCPATMALATTTAEPWLTNAVLHESAHNLGPTLDAAVALKRPARVFGGHRAAMLDELKAEAAALYLADWLAQRKLISPELARQAHVRAVATALDELAEGLGTPMTGPRPLGQAAAIELGWLQRAGVLAWKPTAKAANEADLGCLELDLGPAWRLAEEGLLRQAARVMARADRKGAEQLEADLVEASGPWKSIRETLVERWLQVPRTTFVYAHHP